MLYNPFLFLNSQMKKCPMLRESEGQENCNVSTTALSILLVYTAIDSVLRITGQLRSGRNQFNTKLSLAGNQLQVITIDPQFYKCSELTL